MATRQRWHLRAAGRQHVVEIDDSGWSRRLVWLVDGHEVATTRSGDDRVRLVPGDRDAADLGVVGLRFGALGPARRVTWYDDGDAETAAIIGVGGRDFQPEAGSTTARREAWIRTHPRLYTIRRTGIAAAGILLPLLLAGLLARFALSVDLPDLPRPPLPDLPEIPWPGIAWPDIALPGWSLPGWVRTVLDQAKLVGPVVLAFVLARAEIRRRRQQDARRATDEPPDRDH
jgi:hypothetical protein